MTAGARQREVRFLLVCGTTGGQGFHSNPVTVAIDLSTRSLLKARYCAFTEA